MYCKLPTLNFEVKYFTKNQKKYEPITFETKLYFVQYECTGMHELS